MRTAPAPDDRLRTLQYWWMLELFSPQKVPKPIKRSTRPEGRQVIEWRPGEPLPWWSLRRPTSAGAARRRWQHTVYLGVYDLEDVYQYLHHSFAEDRDAYDERRAGSSACAAVMLDDRGVLMVDSATLSSALWAVAQIRDSGAAPSPQWAGGFSLAAQEFKEEADVVEGLRREAALAETAPPQDEDSLWTLLHIAHEASGIAGTPRLDSQRIIISSVVVSDHRAGDTTADIDFLNSFFLDDLAAVQVALADGRCPSALSEYLTADALLPTNLRSDVMTEHAVVDAGVDEARSELFLAAMRLHKDFLANAAGDMLKGLRAAIEVVSGAHPRNLEPEKLRAAWQTFFLVVPMVSTTFASVGRMFAGLGAESFGWLLIDEAGQAPPQYAVGGIWRAQRVIAVGDPLQLQPVVTMPRKAQRDIAAAFGVSPTWIPPRASVQTLADRMSRDGTALRQGEESVWVSMPLTVHRRCDDPMFDLCNKMAYDGMMVSAVHRRLDDPDHPDLFDGPGGEPRIPASQWLDMPATTPGTHLQDDQIARLCRLLHDLGDWGVAASEMIAISPFRVVADKLESLARRYPGLRGGTIHTAQGREADVVFLVLGGDPGAPGAKAWASSTVNLVNVAASRAKRRLYVIGDRAAWAPYPYFNGLAAALGRQPGAAPEAGG